MPMCCAFGCNNRQGCGLSFHLFPFNRPTLCEQWISNVRRDKWTPNRRTLICGEHFEDSCFDKTGQTVRLRADAIPTKFSYPERLRKVKRVRPPPRVRSDPHVESSMEEITTLDTQLAPPDGTEIIKAIDQDHNYYSRLSPQQEKKLNRIKQRHLTVVRKLAVARQANRRMLRKVNSLQEVVDDLKAKFLLSANCESMLEKTYGNVLGQIIGKKQRNASNTPGKSRRHYSPSLRSFALTLQFCSSKAYNYVRKTFDLCLPHPSTLRRWYSSVNAEPGFCEEAFDALKMKAASSKNILCAMMLDEMSIRKHIEWDGTRFRGYVDIGAGVYDDDLPVATDALVFMLVGVNDSWKVPFAYFLVSGLSGEERANLVRQALMKLSEIRITVMSLTCDGPSCHFSMARALGATLDLPEPMPWFPHPQKPEQKVYFILDVCHMLKLIRNALSDLGIILDGSGNQINWKYVEYLHILQEYEGLRAGNKLRTAHIQWRKQKMKVSLAAQTISSSVADAIEFCAVDLGLPQFVGSEATVKFLRTFDRLFDLLNSRNPFGKGFKAPMKTSNEGAWKPFMEETCAYILELTDYGGTPLYKSKRKTGFVGFYVSTLNMLQIYDQYVTLEAKLKYVLTYKFSQDHLELFFSSVRARGGRNNNPTAKQFKDAFKRLLVRHEVHCANGNVEAQDNTKILHTLKDSETGVKDPLDIVDISSIRLYDMTPTSDFQNEDLTLLDFDRLSRYSENVVGYIAGFVVKMVESRIHCPTCLSALRLSTDNDIARPLQLLQRKTRGGLVKASVGLEFVCRSTERCVRTLMTGCRGAPNHRAMVSSICLTVLQDTCARSKPIFPALTEHMYDTAPDENHLYRLITVITTCYLKVRLHHIGKTQTERLIGDPVRRRLTKLILFKHQ